MGGRNRMRTLPMVMLMSCLYRDDRWPRRAGDRVVFVLTNHNFVFGLIHAACGHCVVFLALV